MNLFDFDSTDNKTESQKGSGVAEVPRIATEHRLVPAPLYVKDISPPSPYGHILHMPHAACVTFDVLAPKR